MVLEAWYYTRAAGTDVVHSAITTAARGVESQALTSILGQRGDGSYWYTGRLVYWCP